MGAHRNDRLASVRAAHPARCREPCDKIHHSRDRQLGSAAPRLRRINKEHPMQTIEWQDFEKVELRVGTIRSARPNEKAVKPAYVLEVDLGELGLKTSSAQLTAHYSCDELPGRQVLCVCNFAPKRIAGVRKSW
jgi:tRNA-binding protein